MQKEISLTLSPKTASSEEFYKKDIAKDLKIDIEDISFIEIIKRSIDARKKDVKILLKAKVWYGEHAPLQKEIDFEYQDVSSKKEIIIVGAGPAGLFAALKLIEKGLKPLILERGKSVSERKVDIASINRNQELNPNSNYCFGEGGAGTFSDGKLFTRSKKRGNAERILEILQYHGADKKILTEANPHIGTNNLPRIISNIRETIINAGGEIHFNTIVKDLIIKDYIIKGVITNKGDRLDSEAVILATGHSAEDIYEMLYEKDILLEAKSFAMGVRVEHPQDLIDSVQYHCNTRSKYLPAASYSLVTQVENRGVYSFCMCPGGFIVPAATGKNEIVVNGMSPSKRNSPYANSGIVVEVRIDDFPEYEKYGVLAGLKFRQNLEKTAFLNGGQGVEAPAQILTDFVKGRLSGFLNETSYNPGIISSPLHFWLPEHIGNRLKEGFKVFNKKIKGFLTEEAQVIGVESRTSSPLRIPRDKITLEHPQIKGLYPCGEGAGYAGGIVSSSIDGERCAEMIAEK